MNLIYYDLYQSTRLEKFVTGMLYITTLVVGLYFYGRFNIILTCYYYLEHRSLRAVPQGQRGAAGDVEKGLVHGRGASRG